MQDIDLFPCYSVPLRNFLNSKGLRYKLVGLHPESKCMFWVYIKTKQLDFYLDEWKETANK
jgi:hypothetical protein